MTVLTVCTSASFYKQAVEVAEQLHTLGFEVVLPETARKMETSGDFDVSHYKTWFKNSADYHKKSRLMREHFKEIEKGDAVLVLNYEKHGQQNYIGGNVLMEMSLAFWLNKPIYVLNSIPEDSPFVEEIKGFEPIILSGKLEDISL